MSVLRFLKHHLGAFALVCLLLAVQAVSELALPQMMSDIVDVGIGPRTDAFGPRIPSRCR